MNNIKKQRIEWIDTAKGICILLVVLHHVSIFLHVSYPCSDVFIAFRMPLYFILSGLFFKTYSGIIDFSIRKTNKLLIPYLFFFGLSGVILPVILYQNFGIRIWSYKDYGFEAFKFVFSEIVICNPSIWFLQCLFEVNILFYLIQFISKKHEKTTILCALMSFIVGCVGLFLKLPFFVDSAMSATPFFFVGWFLRNKTSFLTTEMSKYSKIATVFFCVVTVIVIHYFSFGTCGIHGNNYGGLLGIIHLYPYGVIGTLCVLQLSHIMGRVPFLSYIGRYSIIILCTHAYLIQLSGYLSSMCFNSVNFTFISTFVLSVIFSSLMIPVFCKLFPYFTAQKDIFRYKVKKL